MENIGQFKNELGWANRDQINTILKYVLDELHIGRRKKIALTDEQWEAIKQQHNYECARCHRKEGPGVKLTKDRIVAGAEYNIGNGQPLCILCNSSKYDKTIDYR